MLHPASSAARLWTRETRTSRSSSTGRPSSTAWVPGSVLPHEVTGQAARIDRPSAEVSQRSGTSSMSAVHAPGPPVSSGTARAASSGSRSSAQVVSRRADQRPSASSTVSVVQAQRTAETGVKPSGTEPATGGGGVDGGAPCSGTIQASVLSVQSGAPSTTSATGLGGAVVSKAQPAVASSVTRTAVVVLVVFVVLRPGPMGRA
jgi:hypothetical protein